MSLNLDKRQRAMLREMGVRVWQPLVPVDDVPIATEMIAASEGSTSAGSHFDPKYRETGDFAAPPESVVSVAPSAARRDAVPAGTATSAPAVSPSRLCAEAPGSRQASWQLGQAQALYAQTAQAGGARWLVLAEAPASGLQRPAFEGDAGRLLDRMLRAARLNRADAVLFAPLVRHAASPATQAFSAALSALIESAQPDVVLVMGRLAAQALLPSGEPFGKLRGRVHALHGAKTIVTYDAPYLLRAPADKARAWEDLCLAMSLAPAPPIS
ncbi:MAG: uracil-DNA glycosylase family protein [Polaromonas sp.]